MSRYNPPRCLALSNAPLPRRLAATSVAVHSQTEDHCQKRIAPVPFIGEGGSAEGLLQAAGRQ